MEDFMEVRVRYRDTDSTGRIFFSRYLEFFDDAVIEFFRGKGIIFDGAGHLFLDGQQKEATFVVGECQCRFLDETFFDDLLEVITELKELSERKVILGFTCYNKTKGRICVQGSMILVCFDPVSRRSARVPDEVRERLLRGKD
ncbi:hypothetical protein DRN74_03965 [Candidatus Micrarchaeota archaeon]|nr:MAG: hypothetical protein DRN74_03965 [Candidatus Micrarchaeota archaeon]